MNLTTEEIIREKLAFLINDYNFSYNHDSNSGDLSIFTNENGVFEYYEWPQFGEAEFRIKCDGRFKVLHLWEEYPSIVSDFYKKHSGIKWLFKDQRSDYWDMIASIIKHSIHSTNSVFGLKI